MSSKEEKYEALAAIADLGSDDYNPFIKIECSNCKERWKARHLAPDPIDGLIHCPNCGSTEL